MPEFRLANVVSTELVTLKLGMTPLSWATRYVAFAQRLFCLPSVGPRCNRPLRQLQRDVRLVASDCTRCGAFDATFGIGRPCDRANGQSHQTWQ